MFRAGSAANCHEDQYCLIFRCFKPYMIFQALGHEVYGSVCMRFGVDKGSSTGVCLVLSVSQG